MWRWTKLEGSDRWFVEKKFDIRDELPHRGKRIIVKRLDGRVHQVTILRVSKVIQHPNGTKTVACRVRGKKSRELKVTDPNHDESTCPICIEHDRKELATMNEHEWVTIQELSHDADDMFDGHDPEPVDLDNFEDFGIDISDGPYGTGLV